MAFCIAVLDIVGLLVAWGVTGAPVGSGGRFSPATQIMLRAESEEGRRFHLPQLAAAGRQVDMPH
jgi:hypothetical protein